MKKEDLESYLAGGLSVNEIAERTKRHPSTVSYHLKKHGLTPLGQAVHAPNQKVDAARLRQLVANGATVREAAEAFGVGYSTIRYWLKKLDLETARMIRLKESQAAVEGGMTQVVLTCPEHGEVPFFRRPDGNFRCSKCRTQAVTQWRRRVKRRLVERAGGRCAICGYHRHPGALHFHHLDPNQKTFMLSRNGVTRSYAEAVEEADKCILLCANCHAEVEAGVTDLPTDVVPLQLANRQAS